MNPDYVISNFKVLENHSLAPQPPLFQNNLTLKIRTKLELVSLNVILFMFQRAAGDGMARRPPKREISRYGLIYGKACGDREANLLTPALLVSWRCNLQSFKIDQAKLLAQPGIVSTRSHVKVVCTHSQLIWHPH